MLKNSLKILGTTEIMCFELKFLQKEKKISQTYCRDDFSSVLDPSRC